MPSDALVCRIGRVNDSLENLVMTAVSVYLCRVTDNLNVVAAYRIGDVCHEAVADTVGHPTRYGGILTCRHTFDVAVCNFTHGTVCALPYGSFVVGCLGVNVILYTPQNLTAVEFDVLCMYQQFCRLNVFN